jgi:hypothetical protein
MINRIVHSLLLLSITLNVSKICAMQSNDAEHSNIDSLIENPRLFIEQQPSPLTKHEHESLRNAWIADHPLLHEILKTNVIVTELAKPLTAETLNGQGNLITYVNDTGETKSEHLGIRVAFKNGNFNTELTQFLGITPFEVCTHNSPEQSNNSINDPSLALIIQCKCTDNPTFIINSAFIPTTEEISNYCTHKEDIYSSINPTTGRPRIISEPFVPRTITTKPFFIIKNTQGNRIMICESVYPQPQLWSYNSNPVANVCLADLTQSFRVRNFYENRIPLIQLALLTAIQKTQKHTTQQSNKQLELTLKEQAVFNDLWPEIKTAITPYIIQHESTLTTFQKITRLLTNRFYGLIQGGESKNIAH